MDFRALLVLAVLISCATPALFVDATRAHKKFDVPAYFAFGDSLADVGTNNFLPQATARADFSPYGQTFFKKPTRRFTDGRNLVDFIAMHWNSHSHRHSCSLMLASPKEQTSGSGLLDSTSAGRVNPMSVQLQQFASVKATLQTRLGAHRAEKLIKKAIFLVVSGSNYLSSFLTDSELQTQMTPAQFIASVIDAYKTTLLTLYNSGARKVDVFGTGPIGCSPLARATNPSKPGECVEEANLFALGFNAGLKHLVDGLRAQLLGFNLVLGDNFGIVTAMIADGKRFGLNEVTAGCCGAGFLNAKVQCGRPVPPTLPGVVSVVCRHPSKSLFWDALHPTEAVARILFKFFWTGDAAVTYPINLKALAAL